MLIMDTSTSWVFIPILLPREINNTYPAGTACSFHSPDLLISGSWSDILTLYWYLNLVTCTEALMAHSSFYSTSNCSVTGLCYCCQKMFMGSLPPSSAPFLSSILCIFCKCGPQQALHCAVFSCSYYGWVKTDKMVVKTQDVASDPPGSDYTYATY